MHESVATYYSFLGRLTSVSTPPPPPLPPGRRQSDLQGHPPFSPVPVHHLLVWSCPMYAHSQTSQDCEPEHSVLDRPVSRLA